LIGAMAVRLFITGAPVTKKWLVAPASAMAISTPIDVRCVVDRFSMWSIRWVLFGEHSFPDLCKCGFWFGWWGCNGGIITVN
jgi:hypothetical protein